MLLSPTPKPDAWLVAPLRHSDLPLGSGEEDSKPSPGKTLSRQALHSASVHPPCCVACAPVQPWIHGICGGVGGGGEGGEGGSDGGSDGQRHVRPVVEHCCV